MENRERELYWINKYEIVLGQLRLHDFKGYEKLRRELKLTKSGKDCRWDFGTWGAIAGLVLLLLATVLLILWN